jgi:hypothetical protein
MHSYFKIAILEDKLKTEASGILNWLLEGTRRCRQDGLKAPLAINPFFYEQSEAISAVHGEETVGYVDGEAGDYLGQGDRVMI